MKEKHGNPIVQNIILVLVIALSAALQYNAAGYMKFAGAMPNFMLVAVVVAGYALGSESGGFAGLCLGLYQDAQNGKILGMYALFYLYMGVIAGFFPKKGSMGDFPTALIAVYVTTMLYEGAVYLFAYAIPILRGGYAPGAGFMRAVGGVIVPAAFLNAFFGIPYYFILHRRSVTT